MKKMLALLLVCLTLLPMAVSASNDVTVKINGEILLFDVPAQIINDRTMVPMRKIFEALGAQVEWIESRRFILATYGTYCIDMRIDDPVMNVMNLLESTPKTVTMDVPPCIVEGPEGGRTLVPVRAISEALGKKVDWDDETRTVLITN